CAGFPSEKDNLAKVPFGSWSAFHFASLDPACPFDEFIADTRSRLAWLPHDRLALDPPRPRDYLVPPNRAPYCAHSLQRFHIPFVHAGLNELLDYGDYRAELYKHSNLQIGVSKGGEDVFHAPASSPDHGSAIAAYYYWLFPNTMINVYPWGISVNIVRPLAVD